MADKKILVHLGFSPCDRADPWYELVARKFDDAAPDPRFWESARRGKLEGARGLDFFYSPCCPFNRDFTGLMADIAREMGFPVRIKEIRTREDLSLLPIPGGIFSLYHEGELLSTEVMTEPKFRKLLQGIIERGQGEGGGPGMRWVISSNFPMGGNDALFRFLLREAGNVPSLYLGYSPAVEKYHHLLGSTGFPRGPIAT